MKSLQVQILDNLVELIKLINDCKKDKTEEEKKVLDDFIEPILNLSQNVVGTIKNGE